MDKFEYYSTNPGRAEGLDLHPYRIKVAAHFGGGGTGHAFPIRPLLGEWDNESYAPSTCAPYVPEPDEDVIEVGSRLFAISHRDVYRLFRAWGWEDGPERGDGHKRMVFGDVTVQIMPPDRPGTGELGNAKAIKKAAHVMGMTIQEFLTKIDDVKQAERAIRSEIADRRHKRLETQVLAARAAAQQEEQMTETKQRFTGISQEIANILRDAGRPMHIVEVTQVLREVPGYEKVHEGDVGGNLSNIARDSNPKWPVRRVTRPGTSRTGQYEWVGTPKKAAVIEAPVKPEPAPAAAPPPPPVQPPVAPATTAAATVPFTTNVPTNLNGSTPELLSKVHVLDGGRYLFQGDDGKLYVVSGLVPLNV